MSEQPASEEERRPESQLQMAMGQLSEKRLQMAGKMSENLVTMIEQEIEKSTFQINEVQKEFKLRPKVEQQQQRRGHNSNWKKNPLESQIEKADRSYEKNHTVVHSNSERKYLKSEMTQEAIQKIKNLKRQQKQHEMDLELKRKMFQENIRKLEEEEKQLVDKQKKEKNEERLKEVAKKIAEIRVRQADRTKKMEEENKKIAEIKHQKALFQKWQSKYKTVQMEEQKKKEELKMAIKKQKLVNFDDIKQHQRKYEQIMNRQKGERQKKLGDLSRGNSKKYYHSRLLKDHIQMDQHAKAEHIQKKNDIMDRYHSQKEYAEMVRTRIQPNMGTREDEIKDRQKSRVVVPNVSIGERHKIGCDYMKEVHENLANLKGSSVSKVVEEKREPFKYKDYLKDIRGDKKPMSSHQKEGRYLEEIDNLMKRGNMTQEQKFTKAKIITQKIQQSKKGRGSQKLITSINAKLHLLKQIEPTEED